MHSGMISNVLVPHHSTPISLRCSYWQPPLRYGLSLTKCGLFLNFSVEYCLSYMYT